MTNIHPFSPATLENLANAIADIDPDITGSVIHRLLLQCNIDDVSANEQFMAKRKKLYNAFAEYQNKNQCANNIIRFIQEILSPQRYVDKKEILVKRIQDLAGVTYDGQNLMEKVFCDNDPILIINNFQSKSEKDEHRGFRNLLIGIVAMFRNPASHELKVEWNMSDQDALDILAMISYCHRRLDDAQKIRLS